jgi:hypothetical protein
MKRDNLGGSKAEDAIAKQKIILARGCSQTAVFATVESEARFVVRTCAVLSANSLERRLQLNSPSPTDRLHAVGRRIMSALASHIEAEKHVA